MQNSDAENIAPFQPEKNFSTDKYVSDIIAFTLYLADTNLILSQRNAEWCGHGPILEQDIAITNISLDLLGQARYFYQYAARLINKNFQNSQGLDGAFSTEAEAENIATEDTLAYLRTEREFRNLLLTELPKGDWAQTVLRQFFISVYLYLLYEQLQKNNKDKQLAAIAEKSIKEISYHLKWSGEWVIRLGDGTAESHQRMLKAFDNLWPYTGEFFMAAAYEYEDITGFDPATLREPWLSKVRDILQEATLWPTGDDVSNQITGFTYAGGKNGIHTEHMGFILAALQYLQRTYPGANW